MKISQRTILWILGIVSIVATLWSRSPTPPFAVTDQSAGAPALEVVRTAGGTGRAGMTGFDMAAHLSNRDLATQSDLIVIGQAVETSTFWADAGRNLFTLVKIAVTETLKGGTGSGVTVALPGGIDANRKIPIAMTYPGAPRISPQEEVFLFLVHADDEVVGTYAVTGFAQGKFSIEPGDAGSGLRVQSSDKRVRVGNTLVPLSMFKDEIRSYVQQ